MVGARLRGDELLGDGLLQPRQGVDAAELGRGDQEPVPSVGPPGAAAQVAADNQAGRDPGQRGQVPLGELGVENVKVKLAVVGRNGVPRAGEDPVQAVTEQGEPGVAEPGEVVTVGLAIALERPPRRGLVRPADAGQHAGGRELLDHFLLFTHDGRIHRRQ